MSTLIWWRLLLLCLSLLLTGACDISGLWYSDTFESILIARPSSSGSTRFLASCQSKSCTWTRDVHWDNVASDCSAIIVGPAEWKRANTDVSTAHIIYMTHLDVGYTQPLSTLVIQQYFDQWYPMAINTSQWLAKLGSPEQFIWTTHAWLLNEYLNYAQGAELAVVEQAIKMGQLQWHAGPMNMQSEVVEPSLFDYGLSIAHSLDDRFGFPHKTTLSQKDVPGATRAIVNHLTAAGVSAMHVGVNDFTVPPAVPYQSPVNYEVVQPFLWEDPYTQNSVICYWSSGYSRSPWGVSPELIVQVPGASDVLVFLMNVDNTGPQTVGQVIRGWSNVQAMFPNATLRASSLDAYTATVAPLKDRLPVVNQEMGDVWVYGVASDPAKVRAYRQIAKMRAEALASGEISISDPRVQQFSWQLLKVPEHTWGFNEGNLNGVGEQWSNANFDTLYAAPATQMNLQSFQDQRAYIDAALYSLGELPVRQAMEDAVLQSQPSIPDLTGYSAFAVNDSITTCGTLDVSFDQFGAIVYLLDTEAGRQWASASNQIGLYHYRTHSQDEFTEFVDGTLYPGCSQTCDACQFAKCNVSEAGAVSQDVMPTMTAAYMSSTSNSCSFIFEFSFPLNVQTNWGAPSLSYLSVNVTGSPRSIASSASPSNGPNVQFDLQFFQKRPTLMPESIWFSVNPVVLDVNDWFLNKMDSWISPFEVVYNGSRNTHAISEGVRYSDKGSGDTRSWLKRSNSTPSPVGSGFFFKSPWCPLVAVDSPSPILFLDREPDLSDGIHWNLFNNMWSTNYPMWSIDTDLRCKFELELF